MKLALAVIVLTITVPASAELPRDLSEEKRKELSAAGIREWPPLKKADSPAFSRLEKPRKAADAQEFYPTDVVYDNGVLNVLPTIFGQIYGNRFNIRSNGAPLASSFFLQSFSFYFLEDSLADTGMSFQISDPLNAVSINSRTSINVTGLVNSGPSFTSPVLNAQTGSILAGTPFDNTVYLGAWCLNTNSALPVNNETLGLNDTATILGGYQGFTALSGTGPRPFNLQAFNAILRATVKEVPVELMSFGIE